MRHVVPALLAVSAAIVATPAAAEQVRIDVPAGRAADAAITLGVCLLLLDLTGIGRRRAANPA